MTQTTSGAPRPRLLLGLLFFASGFSGLVYQVVWMRMLIRVFGVTVYAVSTIIVVFMGGLALGALAASRTRASPDRLLRLYGYIELGIAGAALLSTIVMGSLSPAFGWGARSFGTGPLLFGFRIVLSGLVLLVPTVLMGATLPITSGYLSARSEVGEEAGYLYGVNTLGAVVGVLLAGFVLIMLLGERGTVAIGVAANAVAGAVALVASRGERSAHPSTGPAVKASEPATPPPETPDPGLAARLVVIYGISGFCALAYEVIWSRLLNLVQGNSVYAFSSMLGVYLAGIALGSLAMSRRVARLTRPVLTLALMEIGVGLFAVISLHVYVALGQSETDFLYLYSQLWSAADFGVLFVTSILIVLPVTLLLGAIFPLVTHLCRGSGPAVNLVGRLYGFNTIGSILGSLITGFVFIPTLGTLMTFLILAAVSFGIGVYLLPRPEHRRTALVSTLLFVAIFSFSLEDPFLRVLQARLPTEDEVIDHREDASATVTVAKSGAKRDLYVNGLYVSSTDFAGRFMMHMPLLIHPAPEASLIIGLGAGEAFSTSMAHGVKTTVVDLLPSVVAHFPTFHPEAPDLPTADGARVVINDGRNFLLATEDRFDVVLVDGTPPLFASGMVNLYTLEFVQLVQDHLTDNGIFCLWLPLFSFPDDLWMIVRNFTDSFENVRIWARKGVSGVIVLGTKDPNLNLAPSGEELARRIAGRGLREPLLQPLDITQGFFLSQDQIRRIAAEHPTVTDDRPRTEYPLLRFLRGEELVREPDFLFELETSK